MVASTSFGIEPDEDHILAMNVNDGTKLLRLKYLEPAARCTSRPSSARR